MRKLFALFSTMALLASCQQAPKGSTQAVVDAFAQEKDSTTAPISERQALIGTTTASIDTPNVKKEDETKARDLQKEATDSQKQSSHTAYFVVGSKSMLHDLGLIKGVFKKKADFDNLDNSKFSKVDVRKFKELNINSKKAKLIPPKPVNSYLLIENPDETTTLRITDPDAFWEDSPYLIIQTK